MLSKTQKWEDWENVMASAGSIPTMTEVTAGRVCPGLAFMITQLQVFSATGSGKLLLGISGDWEEIVTSQLISLSRNESSPPPRILSSHSYLAQKNEISLPR